MLENLNDSKTHYFIWLIVTAFILVGGVVGMPYLYNVSEAEILRGNLLFSIILPYIVATIPIGWCFRRKLLKGYIHIPTEKIKIFETNLVLAFCRLFLCQSIYFIDVFIFLFYIAFAIVCGPFFFIYFIISGIIFMAKKRI